MDIPAPRDNESHREVYEPPILDEIGGYTELTRASATGTVVDGTAYYHE